MSEYAETMSVQTIIWKEAVCIFTEDSGHNISAAKIFIQQH